MTPSVKIPNVQYTRTVHVHSSGLVTESHNVLSDAIDNEVRRAEAVRATGLIFSLDLLERPTAFVMMNRDHMASWSLLLQHLSEERLENQKEPKFFPLTG